MTRAIYVCRDSSGNEFNIRLPISTPVCDVRALASQRFSVEIVAVVDELRDGQETEIIKPKSVRRRRIVPYQIDM